MNNKTVQMLLYIGLGLLLGVVFGAMATEPWP